MRESKINILAPAKCWVLQERGYCLIDWLTTSLVFSNNLLVSHQKPEKRLSPPQGEAGAWRNGVLLAGKNANKPYQLKDEPLTSGGKGTSMDGGIA
ncbi:MAG: hypothetical protein R3D45_11810 [Rhizobiaceae bacterium]